MNSFAIAPQSIPFEDIIAVTEATAHRLDKNTADILRTEKVEVLRKVKPLQPNSPSNNAVQFVPLRMTYTSSLSQQHGKQDSRQPQQLRNAVHTIDKVCDFLTPQYSTSPQIFRLPI